MTPLHQAIVDDNLTELQNKALINQWIDTPDELGFTALEVAKFLGKYQAAKLRGGQISKIFQIAREWLYLTCRTFVRSF